MAKSKDRLETPDFFGDDDLDPVLTATNAAKGGQKKVRRTKEEQKNIRTEKAKPAAAVSKKKAGYYLGIELLSQLDRKFLELKLQGKSIENKSALMETIIKFGLLDIEKGEDSLILKNFQH